MNITHLLFVVLLLGAVHAAHENVRNDWQLSPDVDPPTDSTMHSMGALQSTSRPPVLVSLRARTRLRSQLKQSLIAGDKKTGGKKPDLNKPIVQLASQDNEKQNGQHEKNDKTKKVQSKESSKKKKEKAKDNKDEAGKEENDEEVQSQVHDKLKGVPPLQWSRVLDEIKRKEIRDGNEKLRQAQKFKKAKQDNQGMEGKGKDKDNQGMKGKGGNEKLRHAPRSQKCTSLASQSLTCGKNWLLTSARTKDKKLFVQDCCSSGSGPSCSTSALKTWTKCAATAMAFALGERRVFTEVYLNGKEGQEITKDVYPGCEDPFNLHLRTFSAGAFCKSVLGDKEEISGKSTRPEYNWCLQLLNPDFNKEKSQTEEKSGFPAIDSKVLKCTESNGKLVPKVYADALNEYLNDTVNSISQHIIHSLCTEPMGDNSGCKAEWEEREKSPVVVRSGIQELVTTDEAMQKAKSKEAKLTEVSKAIQQQLDRSQTAVILRYTWSQLTKRCKARHQLTASHQLTSKDQKKTKELNDKLQATLIKIDGQLKNPCLVLDTVGMQPFMTASTRSFRKLSVRVLLAVLEAVEMASAYGKKGDGKEGRGNIVDAAKSGYKRFKDLYEAFQPDSKEKSKSKKPKSTRGVNQALQLDSKEKSKSKERKSELKQDGLKRGVKQLIMTDNTLKWRRKQDKEDQAAKVRNMVDDTYNLLMRRSSNGQPATVNMLVRRLDRLLKYDKNFNKDSVTPSQFACQSTHALLGTVIQHVDEMDAQQKKKLQLLEMGLTIVVGILSSAADAGIRASGAHFFAGSIASTAIKTAGDLAFAKFGTDGLEKKITAYSGQRAWLEAVRAVLFTQRNSGDSTATVTHSDEADFKNGQACVDQLKTLFRVHASALQYKEDMGPEEGSLQGLYGVAQFGSEYEYQQGDKAMRALRVLSPFIQSLGKLAIVIPTTIEKYTPEAELKMNAIKKEKDEVEDTISIMQQLKSAGRLDQTQTAELEKVIDDKEKKLAKLEINEKALDHLLTQVP